MDLGKHAAGCSGQGEGYVASMGPQAWTWGNLVSASIPAELEGASMGPQAWTWGNMMERPLGLKYARLQWGPRHGPGETPTRHDRLPRSRCFNGAPGMDLGKRAQLQLIEIVTKELQWGPRHGPGETGRSRFLSDADASLQWGPRHGPGETPMLPSGDRGRDQASMGPQAWTWGNHGVENHTWHHS